jgi:serine/threonine protein phosphatase PrpC
LYQYGAGTNVGNVRDNNEDSYVCDDAKDLWIVADGMGGLGFGEVASAITTYTVTKMVRDGHGINQAIELAHNNIKNYAQSDGFGTNMGTTIVLLLSHGSLYNIFWVGDSRAYLVDDNKMSQVTVDHSLVQSLIDQGEITREQAISDPRKNAVTRALGVQELDTVRADSISERWQPGQKILLCSDGLTDCVIDADIEKHIRTGGTDQEIVDRLIDAALAGGGKDNVTVILVSAPKTAKKFDTDTHVPGSLGRGDDTHIPDSLGTGDDTHIPDPAENNSSQVTPSPVGYQLNLDIEAVPTPIEDIVKKEKGPLFRTQGTRVQPSWYKIGSGIAAAAFLILVASSLQLEQPAADIPVQFSLSPGEHGSFEPRIRSFPAFDYPSSGKMIQVGLFKRLAGAESQQSRLARDGLTPHIEKRVSQNNTLYAVVLGPLDAKSHQFATATLTANGHKYFHREDRGS